MLKLSVGLLSDVIVDEEHTIALDTGEPWVISSITEDRGRITQVSGYRLSTAVEHTLSQNLRFESYIEGPA